MKGLVLCVYVLCACAVCVSTAGLLLVGEVAPGTSACLPGNDVMCRQSKVVVVTTNVLTPILAAAHELFCMEQQARAGLLG